MIRRVRPWLWLLLAVLIVAGVMRLRFDAEILNLLPGDVPAVQGLKIFQQQFSNARELVITVRSSDAEQTEAAARAITESLRRATNLVARATWQPPWLEHPDQAAELIAYLWFNQPPEVFAELHRRLTPEVAAQALTSAREQLATSMSPADMARFSYDPFGLTQLPGESAAAAPAFGQGQELFGSTDGTFHLVFVEATDSLATYRDCARWLQAVQDIAEAARAMLPNPALVAVNYTGRPAFVAEISQSMQHDMTLSVGGTSLIIAVLFWLAHRRWKPMLWLLTLLALILGGTLALGGLIFGTINVVSMGFAAILLGLAVDYAVVHYQEALAHPDRSIPEVRRAIAPSIFWAAVTTISAFLVLNFGGLPGLAQLGSLVGLGVALSAGVMIFFFLPPLFPERSVTAGIPPAPAAAGTPAAAPGRQLDGVVARRNLLLTLILILVGAGILLTRHLPEMDATANALRPRDSKAYATLQAIQQQLNQTRDPLWLVAGGRDEAEVAARLDAVQPLLEEAVSNRVLAGFTLATPLWPRPMFQERNRSVARELSDQRDALRTMALTHGFTSNALALTDGILTTWRNAAAATPLFWPTNEMSRWIFGKITARNPTNCYALGLLYFPTNAPSAGDGLSHLIATLTRERALVSGWGLLGEAILGSVRNNLWKLLLPMIGLVLLSLWLAFRRPAEVLLSLSVLLMSGLGLLAVMRLSGWSWNLLNLMALPLILGTGVDYSIFMQLALRRHRGDRQLAHRSVGRALLLCGATAVSGFGALAFSSNAGMAGLGRVCAVGIAGNMLISVFLLPVWWQRLAGSSAAPDEPPDAFGAARHKVPRSTPSCLYRAGFWRLGIGLVRILPRRLCLALAIALAQGYRVFARRRNEVVIQNLLPAVGNDRIVATRKARKLFREFAVKLVDLWQYEAGLPLDDLLGRSIGWEHFENARAQKRGVLLLTLHLGNWEFGGPWLTQKGIALQVVTLSEPGQDFTRLRQASRARWNIETLVIGDDPFAFIEIIKRLDAGATVALLVDRPDSTSSVTVELFGRPFPISVAAVELARATGCVLLPVCLPREGGVYAAHVLPAIPYERATLRQPAARHEVSQKIIRAFEPLIREHPEQWYHFIPIWPEK